MDSSQRLHVMMGDIAVGRGDQSLSTILGSCVAVVLHDPHHRISGMVHYLLPKRGVTSDPRNTPGSYGVEAIPLLVEKLEESGCHKRDLQAKIFGGSTLPAFRHPRAHAVGPENIRVAKRILESMAIPIIGESIGGDIGRKIILECGTFRVWLKRIPREEFSEPQAPV